MLHRLSCGSRQSPRCRPRSESLWRPALIFLTASTRSLRASGTAASAARFIATTSSSTCSAYPMRRASFSARVKESGSGIRTCGLARKPSVLPSAATAACAPRSSAVRSPASASRCVISANWPRAGTAKLAPKHRHNCASHEGKHYRRRRSACGAHRVDDVRAGARCEARVGAARQVVLVTSGRRIARAACTRCRSSSRRTRSSRLAASTRWRSPCTRTTRRASRNSRRRPFNVTFDSSGEARASVRQRAVTPSSFVIDRRGRVLARYVGQPSWASSTAWWSRRSALRSRLLPPAGPRGGAGAPARRQRRAETEFERLFLEARERGQFRRNARPADGAARAADIGRSSPCRHRARAGRASRPGSPRRSPFRPTIRPDFVGTAGCRRLNSCSRRNECA